MAEILILSRSEIFNICGSITLWADWSVFSKYLEYQYQKINSKFILLWLQSKIGNEE